MSQQPIEIEPVDKDERLGEAIEAFLALVEGGNAPDPEEFAASYPELGDDLREALAGLALVQGLVGAATDGSRRLEAGRRLGGYRIVRELGRGGMGVVYEAVHVDLDRPVALKVLGTHAAPDSNSRRRFLNEAKTAAGLHHTHIVPVFDVGQVGGLCYYAMQRIEGCGLDRVLKAMRRGRSTAAGSSSRGKSGPTPGLLRPPAEPVELSASAASGSLLSGALGTGTGGAARALRHADEPPAFEPPRGAAYFRWAAQLGRQAAEALAHAHRRGVIHRDIKPSNLLVDARGTVWVADFGLARRLADPALTQTDSLLGTPRYMSPEQCQGAPIDGRTDLYSLGATLYELLTLRAPFDGRTAAELSRQIGEREPTAPRRHDPRIPRDLETIVLKVMAKRPADRYANAAELAEDLARFLAHEPVRARRIGPVGRLWRFARRHPALSAVTTAAAAAILATCTVAYVRIVQERDKAVTARNKEEDARIAAEQSKRETERVMRQLQLNQAQTLRRSSEPDRREQGLGFLKRAAVGADSAELRGRLRDEAVEFLAMRDVEARPPVDTGRTWGLAPAGDGRRLGVVSADGSEFRLLDLEDGRRAVAAHRLVVDDPAVVVGVGAGAGNEPPGVAGQPPWRGPWMAGFGFWYGVGIARVGSALAVAVPGGPGVRLFDAVDGDRLTDLAMPGVEVLSMLSSRRGHRLITIDRAIEPHRDRPGPRGGPGGDRERGGPGGGPPGGGDRVNVHLWDLEHDRPLADLGAGAALEFGPRGLPLVAVGPDDRTIAVARGGDREIRLFSADDGTPLGEPIEAPAQLTALALGPEGLLAAAGGGAIWLWDVGSAPHRQLVGPGHYQGFVRLMRFAPGRGNLLAVAGMGAGIELWDLASNALVASLRTPDRVQDVAFLDDSAAGLRLLAAAGAATQSWEVVDPSVRVRLSEPDASPRALAFGPRGRLAMTFWTAARSSLVRVWQPDECPTRAERLGAEESVAAAGFDADGRLAVVDLDGLSWHDGPALSAAGRAELPAFEPPDGPGRRPGPPPDGPRPTDERRRGDRDRGPAGGRRPWPLNTASRSRDGRTLALARGPEVLLWSADHPDRLRRLTPPVGPSARGRGGFTFYHTLALAPDGDRLYLLGSDRRVRAWAIGADGDATDLHWPGPAVEDVDALALGPDGRTLALGVRDGGVLLVDAADGRTRGRIDGEESDPARTLAFSPAGDLLAVGSRGGELRLWSLAAAGPRPIVRLPGHRGTIAALAFDPDARRLAVGDERAVDVWDLARLRATLAAMGLGW